MNTHKLILIIAVSFTFLVNIPRFIFLWAGQDESALNDLLQVSLVDNLFRTIMLFGFCYLVLLFKLNGSKFFGKKHRLLASIVGVFLIFLVWMWLFESINDVINDTQAYAISPRVNKFVYLFIMIMLLVISWAIRLNEQTKLDAIEKEQLKKQNMQNELAALKNQVNPHFLFNSLNTLSMLVRDDQKAAGTFINKLSFLYRYILQSKDKDLFTVKEELKFLESYVYLIKERYRENFIVNSHVDERLYEKKIPALSLQLLMENAVKHNEISTDRPLHVDVFDENGYLVIKNKLQKRTGPVESTHTGLSNLNGRFKWHMNKEIKISMDDSHFMVKIPLA